MRNFSLEKALLWVWVPLQTNTRAACRCKHISGVLLQTI